MQSVHIQTNWGRMHALHWPGPQPATHPPVVLVHGLGMSSRYMIRAAQALGRTMTVWAPDLPGFGRSHRPPSVLDVPQLADALTEWCGRTELPPALFVGHSLGCQVVVELAARKSETGPAPITAMVLAAPTVDPAAASTLRQIGRLLPDVLREPISLGPVVVSEYLRAGLPRVVRTLSMMVRDPLEQKLSAIRVPTLVLQGERDGVVPPAWSQRVARLLPAARYAVIADAAHGMNYSKPIAFAAAITDFARFI